MADKRIDQLDAASALAGTEPMPVVQGGVTVRSTPDAFRDRAIGSLGSLTAASTLDGTEIVGITQGGNPRRATTQEIADLGGGGSSVLDVIYSFLHNKNARVFVGGTYGLTTYSANNETASGFVAMSGLLHVTGKFYFEFDFVPSGASGYPRLAVCMGTHATTVEAGSSNSGVNQSWGIDVDGQKLYGGASAYGSPGFSSGDRGMCALDASGASASIWFGRLGTWYASGDPAAGTNAAFTGMSKTNGFVIGTTPRGGIVRVYMKSSDFLYSPPSGFDPWRT